MLATRAARETNDEISYIAGLAELCSVIVRFRRRDSGCPAGRRLSRRSGKDSLLRFQPPKGGGTQAWF